MSVPEGATIDVLTEFFSPQLFHHGIHTNFSFILFLKKMQEDTKGEEEIHV